MYTDTDDAEMYSGTLCDIVIGSDGKTVQILSTTAEHVLETLERLFEQEHAAFVAAVHFTYNVFPPSHRRDEAQDYLIQLLVKERILLDEQHMELDVQNVIRASCGGDWLQPEMLRSSLAEIVSQ